jgi:hypothetical protein
MNSISVASTVVERVVEPSAPFKVLVVYEEFVSHQKAMEVCTLLARQLTTLDFQCVSWSFEQLSRPGIAEEAARAAADADVIVIATNNSRDLPMSAKAWNERWLAKDRTRQATLIGIVGTPDGREAEASPVGGYLAALAADGGVQFYSCTFALPPDTLTGTLDELVARAQAMSPTMQGILHRSIPAPRWGLNE